jgi:hypothetical protein
MHLRSQRPLDGGQEKTNRKKWRVRGTIDWWPPPQHSRGFWGPFFTSPLALRGELGPQGWFFPLEGMFTPSFTPRCEHSLLFRRMEGRTEFPPEGTKFTPGGQLRPWGQSFPLGAKLRMGLWRRISRFQTRCDTGNNCNNDPGDFSGGDGGSGAGASVVVVPGRKNED